LSLTNSTPTPWVETFVPGGRDWRRILTAFAAVVAIFEPAPFEMVGTAFRLFGIESERLELLAPFSRQIAEPLDADATGQATFYGSFDKIGCKEGERDCHIDLPDAAFLARAKFGDGGYST
jgi:hypothetical protein